MSKDREARELAAKYGMSIRKAHGSIKMFDREGNELEITDMDHAKHTVRMYRDQLFTTPVFDVRRKGDRSGMLLAAKTEAAAKKRYRESQRLPESVELVAKKVFK